VGKRHFEQLLREDRPPPPLSFATPGSLPATQGQCSRDREPRWFLDSCILSSFFAAAFKSSVRALNLHEVPEFMLSALAYALLQQLLCARSAKPSQTDPQKSVNGEGQWSSGMRTPKRYEDKRRVILKSMTIKLQPDQLSLFAG